MQYEPGTLRPGWIEIDGVPGVSAPREAFEAPPSVRWSHIDGPLLSWAGRLHWLTWGERARLWLGLTTVEDIAQQHWPQRKQFAGRRALAEEPPRDPAERVQRKRTTEPTGDHA